jgi:hypothetical protein
MRKIDYKGQKFGRLTIIMIENNCFQNGKYQKCPLRRTWQAGSDAGLFLRDFSRESQAI